MKPIELLLRLAKIREDQAMANARRATGQVNQAQGFQKQVLDYAKDYENQIMEGAKTGTTVAFIQGCQCLSGEVIAQFSRNYQSNQGFIHELGASPENCCAGQNALPRLR